MTLDSLLELCDDDMKVVISNANGIGGAAYLAWPDGNWTAKAALDEFFCDCYHVYGISIHDGVLYIDADENPWHFGSYEDGEWYSEDTNDYKVLFSATVHVQEPNEEAALDMARRRIRDLDFDYEETTIVDVA